MRFSGLRVMLAALLSSVLVPSIGFADTQTGIFGNQETPPALPTDGPPPLPEDGPPPLPSLSYYIGVGGQKIGPLDAGGLQDRIASGDLTGSTLVWTKGMGDWEKASDREDLMALMSSKPGPGVMPDAFDAKTFVVGKWATSGTTVVPELGEAKITGEETYGADGSYLGVAKLVIDNPPAQLRQRGLSGALTLDVKITGRYKLLNENGKSYSLEFTGTVAISDQNGLGLKQSAQSTETVKYLAIDDNTFKDVEDSTIGRRIR